MLLDASNRWMHEFRLIRYIVCVCVCLCAIFLLFDPLMYLPQGEA